ncbi:MAG TPA: winged helix-turn-helix domain-containing protein [Acidimicrobiia bacterium]|nr:winged helix-turn-helix domain-containing protein [Acidimicrobiia bacterium]
MTEGYQPPAGLFELDIDQARLLADETRSEIITLLAERPATTAQLAEALDRPKGTVGHHLKAMEAAGLIKVVRTRKVRALTEKYYGRVARTYLFPNVDDLDKPDFMVEAMGEMRRPDEGEEAFFTLRHARLDAARIAEFRDRLQALAEEFAGMPRGGGTVYGFIAGVYPTDRPSLREDSKEGA